MLALAALAGAGIITGAGLITTALREIASRQARHWHRTAMPTARKER